MRSFFFGEADPSAAGEQGQGSVVAVIICQSDIVYLAKPTEEQKRCAAFASQIVGVRTISVFTMCGAHSSSSPPFSYLTGCG